MSLVLQSDSGIEEADQSLIGGLAHLVVPAILALLTTIALLYLMQSLIASSKVELNEAKNLSLVDFVRVNQQQEVTVKQRKPKKPPEPEEMPPPETAVEFNVAINEAGWGTNEVRLEDTGVSNAFSFVTDGGYLPIVKVQPVYPRSALVKGLEGWVVVRFTVDELGRVVEPEVIENCAMTVTISQQGTGLECWDHPNRVFDQAALRAASKFKYKPKIVDGVAVVTPNVRNKITFQLAKE